MSNQSVDFATAYAMAFLGLITVLLRRMADIDRHRNDAEAARGELLARVQQQAANLQFEVAERTFELQESSAFKLGSGGFSLSELASLAEAKAQARKPMISELRKAFVGLKPTGGLLNLPLYSWKSLFTTNYDELIEASYQRRE